MAFVYVLKCPDTGDIRYVGKSDNPRKRFSSHLCDPTNGCRGWIEELSAAGKKPVMEIVEETSNWEARERYWIKLFRGIGCDLLNVDDGGIVRVYAHKPYLPAGSLFRKATQSIAQKYRLVSKEAKVGLKNLVKMLKETRKGVFEEFGEDGVGVFDRYVYEEIVEGKSTCLKIFG